jgi:hypothetical protein
MISVNGSQFLRKSAADIGGGSKEFTGRGYKSYAQYRDVGVSAADSDGQRHSLTVEAMWGELDPMTKIMIYQKCPPVFAVISGRANRISTLDFNILPQKKIEDKIVHDLKDKKDRFAEVDGDSLFDLGQRIRILTDLRKMLPGLKSDMSNFDRELYRWSYAIKQKQYERSDEIKEFFLQPSRGVQWSEFIKQSVVDLLVHGRLAIYKQPMVRLDGTHSLGALLPLPGGSVYPVKGKYVGDFIGYVQMVDGFEEPQLFRTDEVCMMQYMPNSGVVNGMTPLDCLVNMASENLLFSELMARYADGSKPPEKVVVFGEPANGMGFDSIASLSDGMDKAEQRRVENKLNRIKREAGVAILTGVGTPMVLDLTRSDTMTAQMERQNQIDKNVAMVYNSSNAEINQTGGDGTSGRSTSETQERAENAKAIRSTIVLFEEKFTHEIIPDKFGYGYYMEFTSPRSDEEQVNLAKIKADSGLFSRNEIRVDDFNKDPINQPEFDIPQGAPPAQQGADALGSIAASLKTR